MLDYASLSTDELRQILASVVAELNSRRNATVNGRSTQHLYRITMRKTANAEPQAFRFTLVDGTVVQLPLRLELGNELPQIRILHRLRSMMRSLSASAKSSSTLSRPRAG